MLLGESKAGRKNLYVLSTLGFLISVGFGLIFPFLPLYVEQLGGGAFEMGLLLASFMVTRAIFATPFGNISDVVGRKKIIAVGALLYSLLAILFTLPSTWIGLLFVRAFQGVASAMVWPVGEALVVDSVPSSRRGAAMGTYIFASNLGFVAGPFLGGGLLLLAQGPLGMDLLASLRFPFYIISALALIALILHQAFVEDILKRMTPKQRMKHKEELSSYVMPKKIKRQLNILYINAVVNGFSMGMISFITIFYLMGLLQPGEEYLVGIIAGLSGAIGMVANIPAGRYADKVGRKPLAVSGGYFARGATVFMPFANSVFVFGGLMASRSFAFQVAQPAIRALQADIIPVKIRGRLIGLIQTAFNVGTIVGGPLGGYLYDVYAGRSFDLMFFSFPGVAIPFFVSAFLGFATITLILLFIEEPSRVTKAEVVIAPPEIK